MKQKIYRFDEQERIRLSQQVAEILQGWDEIIFAYLFGSFVEGLLFHDIDVGVYLSEIKQEESILYGIDLALILSKSLRIPVDVRVLNFASIPFLYHVMRGNLILDRDEDTRLRLVERTIARYLDLKPLLRRSVKEAFGG